MTPSPAPLSPRATFLVLSATRWAPVGLLVGLFTLIARERGLSVQETLSYASFQGIAVLLLELPSSGLADALGRRPLLLLAGVLNIVTLGVYLVADSFWLFALSATLMGIYRALDSGPLEAWYVDAAHAMDPDHEVAPDLAAQGTVLGLTIAAGSLVAGGLVAWHPLRDLSALTLPLIVAIVLAFAHLLATAVLLREPRGAGRAGSVQGALRQVPTVIGEGLGVVRRSRVLAALLAVELGWCAALVVIESLYPLWLAELLGGTEAAGRWLGPASAAGWGAFAAGSHLAGLLQGRLGVARTAVLARVFNGAGAVVMGLALGPAGLIGAYLLTYALHGTAGAAHGALLHREATSATRATVLSLNSLVFFAAVAAWGPLLGGVAETWGVASAMVVGGAASVVGLLGYLPARAVERASTGVAQA